jgi:hypothetical protein
MDAKVKDLTDNLNALDKEIADLYAKMKLSKGSI